MNGHPVITVDGTSGSGKTTLGRRLAAVFTLPFVDTGPIYRGVMVAAVRAGVGAGDRAGLIRLAETSTIVINTDPYAASWEVKVDGEDGSPLLRDPAYTELLSTIAQIPEVRTALLPLQRRAASRGAVAIGRDCGTVVFPTADVKFYLEAAADVRVQRRDAQLRAAGRVVDFDTVIND